MKNMKIMLPTINDAKAFVTAAGKCDFDVDIYYNHIVIDAKSILGVLSLDLTRELNIRMYGEDADFEAFLDTCKPKNISVA